jgi:hypothetical protein
LSVYGWGKERGTQEVGKPIFMGWDDRCHSSMREIPYF